eukprot:15478389-Alexandrium_andersonii.AAC.1
MTANAVSRALLEHSFIDRVRGSAERLRGSAGEGFPALEDVEARGPRCALGVLWWRLMGGSRCDYSSVARRREQFRT